MLDVSSVADNNINPDFHLSTQFGFISRCCIICSVTHFLIENLLKVGKFKDVKMKIESQHVIQTFSIELFN